MGKFHVPALLSTTTKLCPISAQDRKRGSLSYKQKTKGAERLTDSQRQKALKWDLRMCIAN